MVESLTDSIDLVMEQHGEIMKTIGVINKNLDKINKRLDKIENDIADIKCKLDSRVDRKEFEKRVVKVEKLVLA